MTFKKIWNALTSDLREDLWNELTTEQKISLMGEISNTQFRRLYNKLTPNLKNQAEKFHAELIRYQDIDKLEKNIIKLTGKLNQLKKGVTTSGIDDFKEDANREIRHWYEIALGNLLLFKKDSALKPQKIIDLEQKYFWENKAIPMEEQKRDWDKNSFIVRDNYGENEFENITLGNNFSNAQGDEFCINPNNPYEDEHYVDDSSGEEGYSENENDGRDYDEC